MGLLPLADMHDLHTIIWQIGNLFVQHDQRVGRGRLGLGR
jgi:hypothetical protein